MNIPVKVISKVTNRVVEGNYTPRQMLDFLDEDDLITNLTMCNCQPVGETYVVDCSCYEEWDDCTLLIGDEVKQDNSNQ